MQKITFSIYRVKFVKNSQFSLNLKQTQKHPKDYFVAALNDLMSGEFEQNQKKSFRWHIGNLKLFNENDGYFAFGRTSKGKIEKFDSNTSKFLQEEQDESPFTHCLFNSHIGIVGIAKKYSLSPNTNRIAKKLQKALSKSFSIIDNHITVEVLPIPDPDSFVDMIRSAHRILSFTSTFGKPNPFDADTYFQKPLAKLLAEAHGKTGTTTIKGNNLDGEVITEIAKSSASTGNHVSARIQKTSKDSPKRITLDEDALERSFQISEDLEVIVKQLTDSYMRVRYDG